MRKDLIKPGFTGLLGILLILFTVVCSAAPQAKEYSVVPAAEFYAEGQDLKNVISYQRQDNFLTLSLADDKVIRLQFISPTIVRVRFNKDGNYDTDTSYAVIKSDLGPVDYNVEEQPDKLVVRTTELRVEINKNPYGISIYKDNILINADTKKAISWNDEGIVTHKKILPGAKFYGFGEKSGPLVKNGLNMTMWNHDAFNYNDSTDPLYEAIPFFIETNDNYTYGILFDNTYQTYFNMGRQKNDEYYFGAQDGEINYYFIAGKDTKDVINQYTDLTGRINMPPKWALGYQQCRFSYYPDTKVYSIAKTLRDKKLPADAIYLDIDFMDARKSFTWNKKLFHDVPGMLKNLHDQGFKLITIIDPGMKAERGYFPYDSGLRGDHFVKDTNGKIAVAPVWPGDCVFPDFTRPQTREWWGTLYQPLVNAGFDGFWNDMNEPAVFNTPTKTLPLDVVHYDFGQSSSHAKIHNVYGMEMVRATLDGLNKLRPDNRNFVLSRAGYAGLQRYAAMWTGDNTANWDHLKLNIPIVLNLGLSGIPISGADIGGFAGMPSPELFARWMELGAFVPLYRAHARDDSPDKEPWVYGPEVENISRKYLELRYQMIQYLYDFTYQSYKTGLPIDRPLFMEFPSDKNVYSIEDEFMFGDSILIAPVVQEGASSRKVYLPAGTHWYSYWDGRSYVGGDTYDIDSPLDIMPIFVKEGAIIPTREVVQYIGEKEINPITYLMYPGTGRHVLYLDDENTMGYKKGAYRETIIEGEHTKINKVVNFHIAANGYTPKEKYFLIKILQSDQPTLVKVNEQAVKAVAGRELTAAAENSYYFDADEKATVIKVFDTGENTKVEIE